MPMNNPLIGITVYGMDRPGIIAGISEVLAMNNTNIVDIEQHVLQGLFFMFIVADTTNSNIAVDRLTALLKKKGKEIGVEVRVVPFRQSERAKNELYVMTVLGRDRVGIVFEISSILYQHGINIEKTSLKARDDLISIEWLLDLKEHDVNQVKKFLKSKIEEFGLDVVIQPESIFKRKKRLIVFDMDSTIVENELINEIAKEAGVIEEVKRLTYEAMNGNVDFEQALRNRVSLLKGLPVEVLEKIANEIKLTPGAKELIRSLKSAGYKTALVSGGFTYFTNRLKEELGFDYAFGNELEIKDGK
jgi:phosphoserine phosphatase